MRPPTQAIPPHAAAPQHAGNTDEVHLFQAPDELEIPDHEPPSYDEIIAAVGLPAWQEALRAQRVTAQPVGPVHRARPARRALATTDADAVMAQMLADSLIQQTSSQPVQHQTITLNLSDMLSSLTARQLASTVIILSLMTYMTMVIVHYLLVYTMEN